MMIYYDDPMHARLLVVENELVFFLGLGLVLVWCVLLRNLKNNLKRLLP